MSWLSRFIDGPPDVPPPPTKREQRDMIEANRTNLKGMNKSEVAKWAKSRHKGVLDVTGGNKFGGRTIVAQDPRDPGRVLYHHYNNLGQYAGSEGGGK